PPLCILGSLPKSLTAALGQPAAPAELASRDPAGEPAHVEPADGPAGQKQTRSPAACHRLREDRLPGSNGRRRTALLGEQDVGLEPADPHPSVARWAPTVEEVVSEDPQAGPGVVSLTIVQRPLIDQAPSSQRRFRKRTS